MWQAGSLFLISISLIVVLRQLRHMHADALSTLGILLIWVRLAVASLGEFAVQTEIAGFSLIALSTLATTGLGLLLMPKYLFRTRWIIPFYLFIGFGILSALLNGTAAELQGFLVLWAYFVVVALLLFRALVMHGPRPVVGCLVAVFALPFATQLLSLALNMPKVGPDGTLNYIGGYGHEAVFGLVALTALFLAAVHPWPRASKGALVVGAVVAGLLLANYRTVLIAALPLLLAYLLFQTGPSPARVLRRSIVPLILCVLVLPMFLPEDFGSRFAEIGSVAGDIGDLTKRPEEFTAAEKNILSARAYIWAAYFYGFVDANAAQLVIGHGPDSRAPGLTVHPHNEYLRVLYEFGAAGAILWYGILIHQLVLALGSRPSSAGMVIAAGYGTVFIAALGTSLFNRPEGMILMALLCSTTWYLADQRTANTAIGGPRWRTGPSAKTHG